MKEAYVNCEIAKLLKEKGFREVCHRYYNAQFDEIRTVLDTASDTFITDFNDNDFMKRIAMEGAISIPTHQMAMAWLREEKNIEISITIGLVGKDNTKTYFWTPIIVGDHGLEYPITHIDGSIDTPAQSYEEAVEAALEYTLKKLL